MSQVQIHRKAYQSSSTMQTAITPPIMSESLLLRRFILWIRLFNKGNRSGIEKVKGLNCVRRKRCVIMHVFIHFRRLATLESLILQNAVRKTNMQSLISSSDIQLCSHELYYTYLQHCPGRHC